MHQIVVVDHVVPEVLTAPSTEHRIDERIPAPPRRAASSRDSYPCVAAVLFEQMGRNLLNGLGVEPHVPLDVEVTRSFAAEDRAMHLREIVRPRARGGDNELVHQACFLP